MSELSTPSLSVSSTGHMDGLGRRVLAFDRATGAMLERLHLRPELAAFEATVRERIAQLGEFEDDHFARMGPVEHDTTSGELIVVSEFVQGSRLSDLLDTAQDGNIVPGVDVALGYLLESLPALSTLHGIAGFAHGLIDPARTVLTPDGRVVFLDAAFGTAVERLGLSRTGLWRTFGIASAPSLTTPLLDAALDLSQAAICAVMLVLGRRLRINEYPEGIPGLLMEVVEVAQIRGSANFASGVQRILQRSLPLPGRRPYASADEMAVDLRQLVRRELGVDVCRAALVKFVKQMDAAFADQEVENTDLAEEDGADQWSDEAPAAQTNAAIEIVEDEAAHCTAAEPVFHEDSNPGSGHLAEGIEFELTFDTETEEDTYELSVSDLGPVETPSSGQVHEDLELSGPALPTDGAIISLDAPAAGSATLDVTEDVLSEFHTSIEAADRGPVNGDTLKAETREPDELEPILTEAVVPVFAEDGVSETPDLRCAVEIDASEAPRGSAFDAPEVRATASGQIDDMVVAFEVPTAIHAAPTDGPPEQVAEPALMVSEPIDGSGPADSAEAALTANRSQNPDELADVPLALAEAETTATPVDVADAYADAAAEACPSEPFAPIQIPAADAEMRDEAPASFESVTTSEVAPASEVPNDTIESHSAQGSAEPDGLADEQTEPASAALSEPVPAETAAFAPAPVEVEPHEEELTMRTVAAPPVPASDPIVASQSDTAADHKNSSRRKRREQKSARARKDRLRSTTTPPPEKAKPQTGKSGWLVAPDRAAAFEPAAEPAFSAQAPLPIGQPQTPVPIPLASRLPSFPQPQILPAFQTPLAPLPLRSMPVAMTAQAPVPGPPPEQAVPLLSTVLEQPPVTAVPVAPVAAAPLKVKQDSAYGAPKKRETRRLPEPTLDPMVLPELFHGAAAKEEEPRRFPWKLATATIALVAIGVVAGRAYLPERPTASELVEPAIEQSSEPIPAPTGPEPSSAKPGQIIVQTQPAGVRVLLNGKPVGESPLTIGSVAPGKHVLTFVSSSGTVRRTVNISPGAAVSVDVPVFSGWLTIFAPVILSISEGGRSLGTNEERRVMIAPGHHRLTLTNRELGYSGVHDVNIEAGEVTSLTIDPRGSANFNAVPWAEVWMDGRKLGETPIANLPVPIGSRDFIFRHPHHGERRVAATIRADQPAAISIDFTKR